MIQYKDNCPKVQQSRCRWSGIVGGADGSTMEQQAPSEFGTWTIESFRIIFIYNL